jgi:2-polyprenyl-3-methyl-5-hydroxy-6-metoxy-1,4-benzoquinol methylase
MVTNTSSFGPATSHWRQVVEQRAQQMDAAYAALSRTSADYWRRRMSNSTSVLRRPASTDDLVLQVVLNCLTPKSTVLDVGAGAGRYAIAIAPHVASLTAVEPDAAMLPRLVEAVQRAGCGNVRVVAETWQDADVEPADLVLCAHVLYPIADVVPFIRRLNDHVSSTCIIALRDTVAEPEPLGRLWEQYHGEPRRLQPGYVEAFNLLIEMGIHANVRVQQGLSQTWAYPDLDAAVEAIREHLILAQTPKIDASLRAALKSTLAADEAGLLRLPAQPSYTATLWWEK